MHAGFPVHSRKLPWLLVVLAGATRLVVALADYRSLIANDVYPDDAFYYLRIAANTVDGRGLTFDGVAPTNGFQALYFILLLPIAALSRGDRVLPIHLSGILLAAWAAGTGAVLHALLSRLAGRGVALFGLLLWAICPYFILMSVNGLETGPAMFFALLVPLLYLSWFCGDEPAGTKRALAFGAVCGLAVLARLDLVLLIGAVALDGLRRRLGRSRQAAEIGAVALAGAAIVCLPWLLVSHAYTGHWLPLSGAASREIALNLGWGTLHPIWSHVGPENRLFDPRHVPASFTLDVATKLAVVFLFENPLLGLLRANVPVGPWSELDDYALYRLLLRSPALCATLALAAATALVVVARRRARGRTAAPVDARCSSLRWVMAGFLLLTAVGYTLYSPTHWYFNRYLAGPILLTTVYLLVDVAAPIVRAGRHRRAVAVVALAIAAGQLAHCRFFTRLRWSDTPPSRLLATWNVLGAGLDPAAPVGAFQAGIYGWFSGRDIINLDGKVNQNAAAALHDKRLHEYVRHRGVRYVVDGPGMLNALCVRHAPAGSVSFRSIAKDPAGTGVQLFEVTRGD